MYTRLIAFLLLLALDSPVLALEAEVMTFASNATGSDFDSDLDVDPDGDLDAYASCSSWVPNCYAWARARCTLDWATGQKTEDVSGDFEIEGGDGSEFYAWRGIVSGTKFTVTGPPNSSVNLLVVMPDRVNRQDGCKPRQAFLRGYRALYTDDVPLEVSLRVAVRVEIGGRVVMPERTGTAQATARRFD